MASLPQENDEENPNLGVNPVGNANPEPTSAASGTMSTTTGQGGATPINNTSPSPSMNTGGAHPTGQSQIEQQSDIAPNIAPYINSTANQNEIANSSTGIATTLGGETNATNTAITGGNTALTNAVTAGTPQLNPTANADVVNNPTNVSPVDQAALTSELSGTYSGPTNSTSYFTNATTPSQTAASNAEVLEQPNLAGPETYFSGTGVQGQGNSTLDAALYLQTPKAQQEAKPAILAAQAAPAEVSGAEAQGNDTTIPQGTTNAQNVQAETTAALSAGESNYAGQGNSQVQNNIDQYNQLAATTQNFLQNPVVISGTPTATQTQALSALGYTVAQWNELAQAYENLAQLQYVQGLIKQSGFVITQDPTTGQFINQLTGDAIIFPPNLPPPAGIDLSKGLTVAQASELFNMSNSATPATQADITALETLLGQSATTSGTSTGANGTQFTYAPPNLSTNLTSAQQSLTTANNEAEAAIHAAESNPNAALTSGTTLGVAYAIGGAALVSQLATASFQTATGTSTALSTALGNQAYNLATEAGSSDAVANGAGAAGAAVGEALSVIGAIYGIYNFIAGYQSGNSGVDALNGAEAGAAVGTLILPGIGTIVGAVVGAIVGAIAGLFGYKSDPETSYWTQYQSAAIQAGVDSDGTQFSSVPVGWLPSSTQQELADSVSSPATIFEGLMDIRNDTGIPPYSQYGRMGGGAFIVDMTKQIDAAAQSGAINYYSTPQQIYTKVVAPWIAKMGTWSNQNSQVIVALIISMIGQYTSGDISSWQWINGTNYLAQQTTPFANFVSDTYAPSNFYAPQMPGNTVSNPISYTNGQPTQLPNPT